MNNEGADRTSHWAATGDPTRDDPRPSVVKAGMTQGVAAPLLDDGTPLDDVDESLVAYLDGELDANERQRLEAELGRSDSLRARLRVLQTGWELLDELPQASPSSTLLETTIRMAAMTASTGDPPTGGGSVRPSHGSWLRSQWLIASAASVAFLALGIAISRGVQRREYQRQLEALPVAMHLDAYLHSGDLQLMRTLSEIPQWRQALEIADRLGEWDFSLAARIDQATPAEREQLLPELSFEDQQAVAAAWSRYSQIESTVREKVSLVAGQVQSAGDSAELLKTMDRFARWRETLTADERDLIASGDETQRREAIEAALARTTRNWTRQTTRTVSDADLDTLFHALRHVARIRIKSSLPRARVQDNPSLTGFLAGTEPIDPRIEAYFLMQFLGLDDSESRRWGDDRGSSSPPPPPPPPPAAARPDPNPPGGRGFPGGFEERGFGSSRWLSGPTLAPVFSSIRDYMDRIRGPLTEDELWLIYAVLSPEAKHLLDAVLDIPGLGDSMLRSWADESLRRVLRNRTPSSIVQRYQAIDPARRDEVDLLPPERMLDRLQDSGSSRR